MPQAGIVSRKIGSIGPRLGIYRFARDGDWIGLKYYHRFTRVGAAEGKDQESYLDLRVEKEQILKDCSVSGWGVLVKNSLMPESLSKQVASQGEEFAAAFENYCRWLLFLPNIEAEGEKVDGFELSMAQAAQKEIEAFLRGIDPQVSNLLREDIDCTIFLNPTFIESIARSEEYWISTLGILTGKIMMKFLKKNSRG